MFYIIEKRNGEKFKMYFFTEIVGMLESLNERLSKVHMEEGYKSYYNDHADFESFIHKKTLFLSWVANSNIFGMGYLTTHDILASNEDLSEEKRKELKDLFKDHMDLLLIPQNELDEKDLLKPDILLDLMFKKCLTDLYILVKFLGLNEDHIYQAFVLYLNKTIEYSPTVINTDLVEIRDNFFENCNMSDEDIKKYDSLLLFYLKNKKIETFSVKYISIEKN